MPNITQFLSRALPEAPGLMRMPAGGLAQPLAEGLGELSAGVQKFAQARQKAIDDFEQAKQKIAEDTERSVKTTELYQGLGELDDSLKGVTNSKEHEVLSKKGLIDLKNRMISTTGNPVVRQELINDLNPRFERLFIEKYKPEADKILFNNAITAKIEEKEKLRPAAIFNQGTPEGDEARDKIILGFVDLRDAGLITPQKALEGQMELLKDIDLSRAQRDLESDPASVALLTEKEILKKYPNLQTNEYFALFSKQNAAIRQRIAKEETGVRRLAVLNLKEKANKNEITFADLDEQAQKYGLSNEDYNFLKQPLDVNLRSSMKLMTEYIKSSNMTAETGEEAIAQKFAPQQGFELSNILDTGKSVTNRKILFAQRELQMRARYEKPQDIWRQIADRHIKGITPEIVREANRIIYGIEQQQRRQQTKGPTAGIGPTEEKVQTLQGIDAIGREIARKLQAKEITLDEFEDLAEALSVAEDEFLGREPKKRSGFLDWMSTYFPLLIP